MRFQEKGDSVGGLYPELYSCYSYYVPKLLYLHYSSDLHSPFNEELEMDDFGSDSSRCPSSNDSVLPEPFQQQD